MKDKRKLELKNPVVHQRNENCQVFNGPISGCVFAMPGATVNQAPVQQVAAGDVEHCKCSYLERSDCKSDREEQDEPLRPGVFDTRIFSTDERLKRLRDTIASAIDMGDATIMYGQPQAVRIDPAVQSEWYYILKPVEEAGITRDLGDMRFVEQMVEWFPMLFPGNTPEQFKEYKRRLARSIAEERRRWRKGNTREVVTLKDMWAKGIDRVLGTTKANRVYEIAYRGLYTSLTSLKHAMERENNSKQT